MSARFRIQWISMKTTLLYCAWPVLQKSPQRFRRKNIKFVFLLTYLWECCIKIKSRLFYGRSSLFYLFAIFQGIQWNNKIIISLTLLLVITSNGYDCLKNLLYTIMFHLSTHFSKYPWFSLVFSSSGKSNILISYFENRAFSIMSWINRLKLF